MNGQPELSPQGGDQVIKTDQAVRLLREAITNGRFQPGEKLRQAQIAQELGLSPTPVREALRRLQAEGLVIHTPMRGVRVSTMSLEDIRETYLLIAVLEGLAARQIATQVRKGTAEPALAELRRALDGTAPDRSPDGWVFPDNRFHIALDAACPLPHLRTLLQGLWAMIPRDPIGLVRGRAQRVTPDHTAILDAIAAGDGGRAERLVRRHLAWVSRTRIQFLKSVPTRSKSDHLPGGNGPAGSPSAGSLRHEQKRRRGSN